MSIWFSVIIPVYNRIDELKRSIGSILMQTYKNYEIIVVDDGSDIDILKTIKELGSNIKYIRIEKNRGVSHVRNIAIKEAKYDYIALLDSDDAWLKTKLETQSAFLQKNRINLVHTEEIWIRNGVRVNQMKKHFKSGGDIFERSLDLCLISPSSVVLSKEIFDRYGYFDENMPVCEDYDLWLRITAFEDVGFIDTPLIYKYGGHPDQLSRKYEAMDKFRVYSLIKLLKSGISDDKKKKASNVLLSKLTILTNGALKRCLFEEAEYYKNLISEIQTKSQVLQ